MKQLGMNKNRSIINQAIGLALMSVASFSTAQIQHLSAIDTDSGIVAGSDCSRSDVVFKSTQLSNGLTRLSITFKRLKATLDDGNADRATCVMRLPGELAAGTRIAVYSIKASGRVALNQDSVATISNRFAILGLDSGVRTISIRGDELDDGEVRYSRELLRNSGIIVAIASPCMREDSNGLVQLNTAISIQQQDNSGFDSEDLGIDHIDTQFGGPIHPISNGSASQSKLEITYRQEICQ